MEVLRCTGKGGVFKLVTLDNIPVADIDILFDNIDIVDCGTLCLVDGHCIAVIDVAERFDEVIELLPDLMSVVDREARHGVHFGAQRPCFSNEISFNRNVSRIAFR